MDEAVSGKYSFMAGESQADSHGQGRGVQGVVWLYFISENSGFQNLRCFDLISVFQKFLPWVASFSTCSEARLNEQQSSNHQPFWLVCHFPNLDRFFSSSTFVFGIIPFPTFSLCSLMPPDVFSNIFPKWLLDDHTQAQR